MEGTWFGPRAKRGVGRAFQRRPFRLLLAAGVASVFGFTVGQVALMWVVFSETRSALLVAYMGIVAAAAVLLVGVAAGPLVDRYDRGRLMVIADLGRFTALTAFVTFYSTHGFDVYWLMATVFALGGLTSLLTPAEETSIPLLVAEEDLGQANGVISSSRSVSTVLGGAVAGLLLVGAGTSYGLLTCALTFLLSALLLLNLPALHPPKLAGEPHASSSFMNELAEGFGWLARHRDLLWLTVASMLFNFCSLLVVGFVVFYSGILPNASPALFGFIVASLSAGTAVGPLITLRLPSRMRSGRLLLLTYGAIPGAVAVILGLVPSIPVALTGFFLLGFSQGLAGVVWLTAAQRATPSAIQGRILSADSVASQALFPVGEITGGLLVTGLGAARAYLVAGVIWLAVSASLWAVARGQGAGGDSSRL